MKKILLISVLIASYAITKSQVFNAGTLFSGYYDINPDTLLNYVPYPYTHETFSVNVFGDPSNDLEFVANGAVSPGGSGLYIKVTSLNPKVYVYFGRLDSVFIVADNVWDVTKVAKPLNYGDQINALNAVWESSTLYLTDHSGHGGGVKDVNDFIGGDKYLGLKYQNGTNVQYAWVRLECISKDSCYLKDFSYSGTIAGIKELTRDQVMISPNPVRSCFYLKNTDSFDISNLTLGDVYGNEVKFSYLIRNNDVKIDIEESLPAGCYTLQFFLGGYKCSRKLIKTSE